MDGQVTFLNSVEELSKVVLCRHIYLFYLQKYLLTPFGKKQRIKGIEINGIDLKLSQYADDTTLILDGSEESFLESVILIEIFGNISGLRLNIKKTEALWIGSKKDCDLLFFLFLFRKTSYLMFRLLNGKICLRIRTSIRHLILSTQ